MRRADGGARAVCVRPGQETREIIEVLRMRIHLLSGDDRALLEMRLDHGNSFREIARLMGVNHRSVSRRLQRIMRRLSDDTYEVCLGHREDFSGRELAMIKDHLVCGRSMPWVSRSHGVTLYRVKSTIDKARRCARSARRTT